MKITGSVLVHTNELDKIWIDECVKLGIPRIGIHPVGGLSADKSLADLIDHLETEEYRKILDYAAECGLEVEYEMHAARYLLPASEFDEHPDWFRMNENGERVTDINFCVTNEDALDYVAKKAAETAKKLYRSTNRYFFWMDDKHNGECHCPKCSKYSISDQQLIVANRIVRELRKDNPNAMVAYLAYFECVETPKLVKPEDGVFLEYAPYKRNMHLPLCVDDEKNNHENKCLKELLEYFGADTAKVLDYWLDNSLFSAYKKPPKLLNEDKAVVAADFPYYIDLGFKDITTFACYLGWDYRELYGMPDIMGYANALRKANE